MIYFVQAAHQKPTPFYCLFKWFLQAYHSSHGNEKSKKLMHIHKYLFSIVILFLLSEAGKAQAPARTKVKAGVEIVGSAFADSRRWFYKNGEDDVYSELRLNLRFSKIVEAGIFAGHQYKSYIYFKEVNVNQSPLFMERRYIPAGIYGRINITDIFSEKLKLIKRREKWDIYNQVILARMNGFDKRDSRDDGQNILYLYPYVIHYGKVYLGLLAGVKYHATPHLNFFIEAGDGAMMTAQIGAGWRF